MQRLQRGKLGGDLAQLFAGTGFTDAGLGQRGLGAFEHRLIVNPEFLRVGVLGFK